MLWADVTGAREAATEEALEKPVVKPAYYRFREAEKHGGNGDM
jgi:hypothetical protein